MVIKLLRSLMVPSGNSYLAVFQTGLLKFIPHVSYFQRVLTRNFFGGGANFSFKRQRATREDYDLDQETYVNHP